MLKLEMPSLMFILLFYVSKFSNGQAYFGFMIHNHHGDLRLVRAMVLFPDCLILKVESWGLLEGLQVSWDCFSCY